MKSPSWSHMLTWICAVLLSFTALASGQEVPTMGFFLAPGKVKLGAQLGSETSVITKGEPGMWKILSGQADFEGRREQIAMHHDAQQVITLNEGDYKVQVQVGDGTQMADLTVKAGEQKVVEVDVTEMRQ